MMYLLADRHRYRPRQLRRGGRRRITPCTFVIMIMLYVCVYIYIYIFIYIYIYIYIYVYVYTYPIYQNS